MMPGIVHESTAGPTPHLMVSSGFLSHDIDTPLESAPSATICLSVQVTMEVCRILTRMSLPSPRGSRSGTRNRNW